MQNLRLTIILTDLTTAATLPYFIFKLLYDAESVNRWEDILWILILLLLCLAFVLKIIMLRKHYFWRSERKFSSDEMLDESLVENGAKQIRFKMSIFQCLIILFQVVVNILIVTIFLILHYDSEYLSPTQNLEHGLLCLFMLSMTCSSLLSLYYWYKLHKSKAPI